MDLVLLTLKRFQFFPMVKSPLNLGHSFPGSLSKSEWMGPCSGLRLRKSPRLPSRRLPRPLPQCCGTTASAQRQRLGACEAGDFQGGSATRTDQEDG